MDVKKKSKIKAAQANNRLGAALLSGLDCSDENEAQ